MPDRSKGIFYGWYVVAACFLTLFLTTGTGFYTFSVFMIPLENTFGASRTAITGVNSLMALIAGFATPVIGILMHAWGPRRVVGLGGVLTGGAFVLMSRATEVWHLYAFGFLLGTGLSATTLIPNQTVVSHWFVKKRGRAMGIVMIGIALGGIVFAPLAHDLIEKLGWRNTYAVFGIVIAVVVVPLAVFIMRRSPELMGLRPDGEPMPPPQADITGGGENAESLEGLAVPEAARTASFWYLFFVQFFMIMGTSIVTAHIVPIVTASPFGVAQGQDDAMMMGSRAIRDFLIVSIAGRFLGGYLAEHLSKRLVLAGQYVLLIGAALLLFKLDNIVVLYAFILLFGMGLGSAVVYPLLIAENFGLPSFSKILGIMGIAFTLGAAIGQVGAASIFDITDSYAGVFIVLMLVFGISAILSLLARPPKTLTGET
jgi:sugar phosphate permease